MKPISWNSTKNGVIIVTEDSTGFYDYSDEYDDALDNDVISFSVTVDSNRIKVFGYGEERPAYDYKDGSEVNIFNRRIEIVIE